MSVLYMHLSVSSDQADSLPLLDIRFKPDRFKIDHNVANILPVFIRDVAQQATDNRGLGFDWKEADETAVRELLEKITDQPVHATEGAYSLLLEAEYLES